MTRRPFRKPALMMLGLMLGAACTSEPARDQGAADGAPAASGPTLESATALRVRNARMPVPNLVTAGQPTEEQLDGLVEAGFAHFISLRPTDERGAGWEEAHAADLSFDFERLPIPDSDALTRENVEALAVLLEAAGDEPTVLYCGSSNRVGAMLALKAYWIDGADPEAALELGQEAGMTRLEGRVRELLGLGSGG